MEKQNTPIPDPRTAANRDENQKPIVDAPTEQPNTGNKSDRGSEHRDEKESYSDYNGNSEENNPARAAD